MGYIGSGDIEFPRNLGNQGHDTGRLKNFNIRATPRDIRSVMAKLTDASSVARAGFIQEIYELYPECFRITRNTPSDEVAALLIFLPLSRLGLQSIERGTFDGRNFDLSCLATGVEPLAGIYLWYLWAPNRLMSGLRLLRITLRRFPMTPFFSTPINASTKRIHRKLGFEELMGANSASGKQVLVLRPHARNRALRKASPVVNMQIARSLNDLMRVFSVRSETYFGEQDCPFDEEFDGNDFNATHVIALIDGEPAGCARLRWFGDFAKIERMTVRKKYRQTLLVRKLAEFAIQHARQKGFRRIYAHSRSDLVSLWSRFGFEPLRGRKEFTFSGIKFIEVVCEFEELDGAISFGCDPLVANRPEGKWEVSGPHESSIVADFFERATPSSGPKRLRELNLRKRSYEWQE